MTTGPSNPEPSSSAADANRVFYRSFDHAGYVVGAPHLAHSSLRRLQAELLVEVFRCAQRHRVVPRVLDLGAGEGVVTRGFLELGAEVTALDVAAEPLAALQASIPRAWTSRLTLVCEDAERFLAAAGPRFDVVAASSFLHHVPDYVALLKQIIGRLGAHGQFFSFQDPMRYRTLPTATWWFDRASYAVHRLGQPDVVGGMLRTLRRRFGYYRNDDPHDNVEYHVVRDGVDQEAIRQLLETSGFRVRIVRYWSAHATFAQNLGERLGLLNTFAVLAQRRSRENQSWPS